ASEPVRPRLDRSYAPLLRHARRTKESPPLTPKPFFSLRSRREARGEVPRHFWLTAKGQVDLSTRASTPAYPFSAACRAVWNFAIHLADRQALWGHTPAVEFCRQTSGWRSSRA